jgi:hypothetical protein
MLSTYIPSSRSYISIGTDTTWIDFFGDGEVTVEGELLDMSIEDWKFLKKICKASIKHLKEETN